MKRLALAAVLASFAAPALAFGIDLALPTLTWPSPEPATQSCITPAGAPTCPQQ